VLFIYVVLISFSYPGKKVFINKYLQKSVELTKELILTDAMYKKRNTNIIIHKDTIYVKPKTLLSIYPEHYLGDGAGVLIQKTVFLSPYYMFIDDTDQTIILQNKKTKKNLHIHIDTAAPEISCINTKHRMSEAFILPASTPVSVFASDKDAGIHIVEYSYDGKSWFPYNTSGKSGLYPKQLKQTYFFRASDMLGNFTEKQITIIVDKSPPQTAFTLTPADTVIQEKSIVYFSKPDLSLSVTAQDNFDPQPHVFIKISEKNADWESYTGPVPITNNCCISWFSKDILGNTSPATSILFRQSSQTAGVSVK
jgi:hypothetical protein